MCVCVLFRRYIHYHPYLSQAQEIYPYHQNSTTNRYTRSIGLQTVLRSFWETKLEKGVLDTRNSIIICLNFRPIQRAKQVKERSLRTDQASQQSD
jgi:hypothetical protein